MLSTCGVEEAKLAKFNVEFDQHFGADAALSPANLIDAKKFQLKTPDVTIQVNPERTDLVQTRVIGGAFDVNAAPKESIEFLTKNSFQSYME